MKVPDMAWKDDGGAAADVIFPIAGAFFNATGTLTAVGTFVGSGIVGGAGGGASDYYADTYAMETRIQARILEQDEVAKAAKRKVEPSPGIEPVRRRLNID